MKKIMTTHKNLPEKNVNPIEIIRQNSTAENTAQMEQFMQIITHLYQFSLLKDILDFTTTKVQISSLKFNIQDKKFFELDEGNCRTISTSNIFDSFLNNFKTNKRYTINIKRIASDVIMHEIGHMVEQELGNTFDPFTFAQIISQDILEVASNTGNISLQEAIKSIMIREVESYPRNHKISELFARYFQILASAKEIVRYGASYSYSLIDVAKVFKQTNDHITQLVQVFYKTPEYFLIKEASKKYIKKIEDIKHQWSEQKIHTFHKETQQIDGIKKPIWKKNFKSIKDNPFK